MALSTTVDDDNLHMCFGLSKRPDLNTEATSYAHEWVVMPLATGFLTLAEIQMLADCIEPVLVLNIPPAAETLIYRGLLVSSDSNLWPALLPYPRGAGARTLVRHRMGGEAGALPA